MLDSLTKLESEISELKASEKNSKLDGKLTFDSSNGISTKKSDSIPDFFKEKLATNMRKLEGVKINEISIDDIEERPREKLWKRYGDYRGYSI